jgi:hypothetical protein
MSCGVLSSCWRPVLAQFDQAQGALVEVLAQWLDQGPVFGEGAQDALGFDHWRRLVAN